MNQSQRILQHLKTKGSITARYAAYHYNIWRCSARILDLRDAGHSIKTIMHETATSPAGDWAEYRLMKENKEE